MIKPGDGQRDTLEEKCQRASFALDASLRRGSTLASAMPMLPSVVHHLPRKSANNPWASRSWGIGMTVLSSSFAERKLVWPQ